MLNPPKIYPCLSNRSARIGVITPEITLLILFSTDDEIDTQKFSNDFITL